MHHQKETHYGVHIGVVKLIPKKSRAEITKKNDVMVDLVYFQKRRLRHVYVAFVALCTHVCAIGA